MAEALLNAHDLVGEHVLDVIYVLVHGHEVPVDVGRGRAGLLHNIRAGDLILPGDAEHHAAGAIGQRVGVCVATVQRAHVGRASPRPRRRKSIRRLPAAERDSRRKCKSRGIGTRTAIAASQKWCSRFMRSHYWIPR